MNNQIYLDNNATTKIDEEVIKSMLPYLTEKFGNPSSTYSFGKEIKEEILKARKNIAKLLNANETEIIFTTDDYSIEIEELDTDEFLEFFCRAAKNLEVYGTLYDGDDSEFQFTSAKGDSYYINSRKSVRFNDELDEVARDEEDDADN